MATVINIREAWLNAFIDEARPVFEARGYPLGQNVRASIGFPSTGARGKRIGECWAATASQDGHFEIFLRPSLSDDGARLADVLTHELVHAAVGLEAKHGKTFKQCAVAMGLEGKMTATVAGEAWRAWAKPVLDALGDFPGAGLGELHRAEKKQTTRMLKCTCEDCGFTFRTAAKWAYAADLTCPDRECGGAVSVSD